MPIHDFETFTARRRPRASLRSATATSALALSFMGVGACGGDDFPARPLLPGAAGPTQTEYAATPIVVEAEAGQVGADVNVVTDAGGSLTYVTAAVNVTDAPASLDDPRVSSSDVTFQLPGEYEIYVRFRIGPNGSDDDSFFINTGTTDAPSWQNANGLRGYDVAGEEGHQPGAIVSSDPSLGGNTTSGRWKWGLLPGIRLTVAADARTRSIAFATREDGMDIDKFAFAIVGDGYTTGYTTPQLDAGQAGVVVYPPVLPDPYEPPATQVPFATGSTKFVGMVCCGNQRQFLENYFNQVVPENGGKWGTVEATRDVFVWDQVDEALAVAQASGFPFRFHVLLWGSQQPDWIETLPPEEQLAEIRQWFEAVSERYGDVVDLVEVVNEFDNQPPTAENEGNYVDALGGAGESGFDWVLTAFRMAREIFPPSARLMLNEYSVVNTDERTERYVTLAQRLKDENLIDALGEQGHAFSTRGPVEQMVANLDRLGTLQLPVYITEMDIDGPEALQLVDFQRVFPAFFEHPSVNGITLWGYRQGMWREAQQATLVYSNGAEKPAFRWLKGYLRGTAPQVAGANAATLASGAAAGAELVTLSAQGPDGVAYPEGTPVTWAVVDGTAAQAVAFAEGTGRLDLVSPLPAGSYQVRVYADVDATVSNLHTIDISVE